MTGTALIKNPILQGTDEKIKTLTVTGDNVGGTVTFNLNDGPIFKLTLNGNITLLTTSNDPGSGVATGFTVMVIGDGTARAVAWASKFIWPGGAPALPSTNGNVSIFAFTTFDQGSTYLGKVIIEDNASGLS
jgi:hypothetical protein